MATNGKRTNYTANAALVERVAHLTFANGEWRSARDVRDALQTLYPDLDIGIQGILSCQRAALENGVLVVLLNLDHERAEVFRLEPMMRQRFGHCGIRQVFLVPGDPRMLDELERDDLRPIHAQTTLKIAHRAAGHVYDLVGQAAARKGEGPLRIGVAWGRMLHAFAQELLALTPPTRPPNTKVYPIVGITDAEQVLPLEANGIASIVARALGGVSAQLQCPAIVSSRQYGQATDLDPVQRMLQVIREQLDLVITGMGPIRDAQKADDITISPDPAMNAELFGGAHRRGASGEICYWCFDAAGKDVVGLPYCSIGLGLDGMRRITASANGRRVLLLTGGDKRRIAPLRAALEGKLVSDLITDTITARVLLGEINC